MVVDKSGVGQLLDYLGLGSVAYSLYRFQKRVKYRLAGRSYTVEIGRARAKFLIPTMNEWTDFHTLDEQPVLEHLLSNVRPDDVFYDIGANTGLYSCLVAGLVDEPIIAFEPHPENADRLEENAEFNDERVSLHRVALAESAGQAELTIAIDTVGSAGHSLVPDERGDLGTITITKIRGDDLITQEDLPQPTIIKIDVEGAEQDVLDGLESALSHPACRLVYCETHAERLASRGYSPDDVRRTLESHGFSVSEMTVREGKGETMLVGEKTDP
jgi:FkbM family methyltransferase